MFIRLAEVIYWIALGLGSLCELLGILLLIFGVDSTGKIMGVVSMLFGLIVVAAGRGIYYIVVGR